MRQPGSNTIDVTDSIRRLLPSFERELPPSVHLEVRLDRSRNIREAFKDIQWTMLITLALVVAVIFAFLHNGSATVIPALALPFSILGTFAVMEVLGFTLDNLSMMALILSIGFVVDDAIVMLENIVRHMEHGEGAMEAALKGSQEIGFTILSMTISLAAVFIPILFMSGVLGRLFREFAVTITTAVLISGLVSVTLTPMLCSRFLNVAALHAKGRFTRVMESIFQRLFRTYEWSLAVVLRHRAAMLAVFVVVLALTARMYVVIPKGFIPDQDNDSLNVNVQAAQGTSYDDMVSYIGRIAEVVNRNPSVDTFFASTGGGFGSMNTARLNIQLVPRRARPFTSAQVAQQLRPQLLSFPGFRAFVSLPPALQIGGRMGNSAYNLTVQSANTAELYDWAARLEAAIAPLREVQDVSDAMQMKSPRIRLVIDRDKAAAGLNAATSRARDEGYARVVVDDLWPGSRTVLLSSRRSTRSRPTCPRHRIQGGDGALVPLESVVTTDETVGPQGEPRRRAAGGHDLIRPPSGRFG
jgi:HAE1 family hydrophobic/amphiphilic exporter-1